MSQPLLDLQRILAGRAAVAGRVLAVENGVARIATADGVVEMPFDGGIGERVLVRDGRVVRVQGAVDVPVFFV
ncbi:MAG: hypothetical protein H7836_02015 [Magnetococcus sp. YQC-3]